LVGVTPKGPARRRDIPSAQGSADLRHLASGSAASELRALCEHVALYAGFPRALDALTVVDEVAGEAEPAVVLVRAHGLDWRMWEAVLPALARGRRVFAYDIRNHDSAAGSPVPFTMDDAS
jgi:3-oxoadipate enol-lactonase